MSDSPLEPRDDTAATPEPTAPTPGGATAVPTPPSGRRRIPTALIWLASAALLAGLLVPTLPRSNWTRGALEELLVGDGRQVLTGKADSLVVESSVQDGVSGLASGPQGLIHLLGGDTDPFTARWVRQMETQTGADGTSEQTLVLGTVDAEGYRVWGEVVDGTPFHYVPARLDVPTQLTDGAVLTHTGYVQLVSGGQTQEAKYTATTTIRREGECWVFTRNSSIDARASTRTTTRCPGRGIVALTTADASWVASDTSLRVAPAAETTPVPPSRLGTALPMRVAEGTVVVPVVPAVGIGSEVAIANRTDEVILTGAPVQGNGALVRPAARVVTPGGDPVWMAQVGGLLLTSTTARQVVAHDASGSWRWSAAADEVVRAAPVRAGTDGVVVATVSGRVQLLDLATGASRWSSELSQSVQAAPLVTRDLVLVATGTGAVQALSRADGTTRWTWRGDASRLVAADATGVLVTTGRGGLVRLGLSDGSEVWQRHHGFVEDGVGLGDLAVVLAADEALGVDVASGDVRWRASGRFTQPQTYGDRVLVIRDGTTPTFLDADGSVLALDPASSTLVGLSATAAGLVGTRADGLFVEWRAR